MQQTIYSARTSLYRVSIRTAFTSTMLSQIFLLVSAAICCKNVEAYSAQQLYQFPPTPFVGLENVGLMPNGDLLLTATSTPSLYLYNPNQSGSTPEIVYTFPNANACLGITETSSNVFAIVVGTVDDSTFTGTPGSFSIWSANFQNPASPTFNEVVAVPQAEILNGLTHLQAASNIVLAADSEQGIVYSINVDTGAVATAIQNAAFAPTSTNALGINGLHVDAEGNTLYFTNSGMGTFGSIPINEMTGTATGSVTIIATDPSGNFYDDFALDDQNDGWITNHPSSVSKVTASGMQTTAFNSSQLLQPTSAIFSTSGQILYIVTDGNAETHGQSGQVWALYV